MFRFFFFTLSFCCKLCEFLWHFGLFTVFACHYLFCKSFRIEDMFIWNTHKDIKINKYWIKSLVYIHSCIVFIWMEVIHFTKSKRFVWLENSFSSICFKRKTKKTANRHVGRDNIMVAYHFKHDRLFLMYFPFED